jgi:hypothetical protein
VPVCEEKLDTVGDENTLLHGEALFVVTACDTEDVAFPFIAEKVGCDFGRDFLVVESSAGETKQTDELNSVGLQTVKTRTIASRLQCRTVFVAQ